MSLCKKVLKIAKIFQLKFVQSISDVVFKVLKHLQYFSGIFLTKGIFNKLFHCMMYLFRSLELEIWLTCFSIITIDRHSFHFCTLLLVILCQSFKNDNAKTFQLYLHTTEQPSPAPSGPGPGQLPPPAPSSLRPWLKGLYFYKDS